MGRVTAVVDKERMAVAKALGVKTRSFLDNFFEAGLTTKEARDSNDISRACYESMPNRTIVVIRRQVHSRRCWLWFSPNVGVRSYGSSFDSDDRRNHSASV